MQGASKLMAGVQHDKFLQLCGNPEKRSYQKQPQEAPPVDVGQANGSGRGKGGKGGGGRGNGGRGGGGGGSRKPKMSKTTLVSIMLGVDHVCVHDCVECERNKHHCSLRAS